MHPSEMTDAELRLAIAEMLGWKETKGATYDPYTGRIYGWLNPMGKRAIAPNYTGNIAAAMGLEDLLTENERKLYVKALYEITNEARPMTVDSSPYPAQFWFIHATARQRSEAWLTAKGK